MVRAAALIAIFLMTTAVSRAGERSSGETILRFAPGRGLDSQRRPPPP